jgi:hypothetical protein
LNSSEITNESNKFSNSFYLWNLLSRLEITYFQKGKKEIKIKGKDEFVGRK